ncbi:MAG: nodulation protein NfeD [Acidobacteriota bacterium]|nr:nodulation protein NfeD [Acidobacteriota bacterium]
MRPSAPRRRATIAVGLCLAVAGPPAVAAAAPDVHQVDVVDIIHSVSARRVLTTIAAAEEAGAGLVLIRLDTPGGLDTAMREIIEAILNSAVPVAVFVGPSGSRAASAGYLITLAADVSGMAPGTNMGAATPVAGTGGEMPETLSRKVESDAAAYLRSIAERRGRDVSLAEQGVTEARSWTASEALEAGLVDLMADNTEAFLTAVHGRTVTRIDGAEVTLDTADALVVETEMSFRDRALSVIANPNLAVLLGMIGLLGLYLEFSNPGLLFPGILGGIALLLAAFGLNFLPVTLLGVLLLLAGIGLLTAEALTPSFGIMGLSGAVALVIGLLFFFEEQSLPTPALQLTWGLVVPSVLVFVILVFFLGQLVVRAQRRPAVTGREGMIGLVATVRSDIPSGGEGKVFVHGEFWDAVAAGPVSTGERVRVLAVEGLTLRVGPASENSPGPDNSLQGADS